jgi:hypothetical protein
MLITKMNQKNHEDEWVTTKIDLFIPKRNLHVCVICTFWGGDESSFSKIHIRSNFLNYFMKLLDDMKLFSWTHLDFGCNFTYACLWTLRCEICGIAKHTQEHLSMLNFQSDRLRVASVLVSREHIPKSWVYTAQGLWLDQQNQSKWLPRRLQQVSYKS